jgi:hypothetical protein
VFFVVKNAFYAFRGASAVRTRAHRGEKSVSLSGLNPLLLKWSISQM